MPIIKCLNDPAKRGKGRERDKAKKILDPIFMGTGIEVDGERIRKEKKRGKSS